MGTLETRERIRVGDRVRIVAFGPKDSWAYAASMNDPTPLGSTGTIIDINPYPIGSDSDKYITCVIHLDTAFINYLVRMSFVEVKLERIEEDGKRVNSCESTEV